MSNGTTIRSPFLNFFTSRPTSTTSPIGSWPRMSPGFMAGRYMSYRCRSDPQMQVDVTLMITSFGSSILGSGTVSQRTSDLPCQVRAFIGSSGSGGVAGVFLGAQDVQGGDAGDGGDRGPHLLSVVGAAGLGVGGPEGGQVEGVAGHAGPQPTARLVVGQDADPGHDLAQAVRLDQLRVQPGPGHAGDRPRGGQFPQPQADAEQAEEGGQRLVRL